MLLQPFHNVLLQSKTEIQFLAKNLSQGLLLHRRQCGQGGPVGVEEMRLGARGAGGPRSRRANNVFASKQVSHADS